MAIFEQKIAEKVTLDDTESLKCVIENSQNINGHTEYVIRVQRGSIRDNTWRVFRRYNDFVCLHKSLQASGLQMPMPPKKLIGNMSREFISERTVALQNFLNFILMNPILASSLSTKKFVDPDNYSTPFHEVALQNVSLALRGEVGWEVVGPLSDIGWRLRKHYFHVRNRANAKDELFASWVEYGPDKYLDEKDLASFFKSLNQLKHLYIHPIELCLCTETGGLTVRQAGKVGSLRDVLCGAKPRQSFLKKYGNPRGHKPLTTSRIALYGKQILEALKFLHEKHIPYGHLHSGNIIIQDDRIKLTDIENGIIGVPSFYRPYFVQHKRISSLEAIDVYSFGHLLFEMAYGRPLHESVCDSYPSDTPPLLKAVLESILSTEACKAGLPTLQALISHKFFTIDEGTETVTEKSYFKLSTNTKEQLKVAFLKIEERLKDEQKLVRSQKKIARVQEMMSSEEEKKKRRQRAKQEQKQQRDQQGKENLIKEQLTVNGISPERSESVNSASTFNSIGTITPPSSSTDVLPPPPPPAPPMPDLKTRDDSVPHIEPDSDRSALFGSICNFDKTLLKKTPRTGKAVS